MKQQIGRNVYHVEQKAKYDTKLSFFRSCLHVYYEVRIKLIERRIKKYASYAAGFQKELFNAAIYEKQAYMHKVEALYSKQELRDYEWRVKRG